MSRTTFHYVCDELRPELYRCDTHYRMAIPVEKRVAIAVWFLATPGEYRTIGHLFGVARCTVCVIVREVCRAIERVLRPRYISFPNNYRIQTIIQGFETEWGVPQCVGAIDGSHIPILAPKNNHTDYYNRKGWYSMILQGVVDHKYRFTDIYIGWPGSVHDARVFAHSSLYEKANEGTLLPLTTRSLGGENIPPFFIGDSAYPLLTWLMKPFPHNLLLTNKQKTYNYRISRSRIVVENAYGRLKGRWRRLLKKNEMHVCNIPLVISACCVLHNICEVHGDAFNDSWLQQESMLASQYQQSSPNVLQETTGSRPKNIRNALAQYLARP